MTTVLENLEKQIVVTKKYLKENTEATGYQGYGEDAISVEALISTVYDLRKRDAYEVSHSVRTNRAVKDGVLVKNEYEDLSVDMVGDLGERISIFYHEYIAPVSGIMVTSDNFHVVIHQNEKTSKAIVDLLDHVYYAAHRTLSQIDIKENVIV